VEHVLSIQETLDLVPRTPSPKRGYLSQESNITLLLMPREINLAFQILCKTFIVFKNQQCSFHLVFLLVCLLVLGIEPRSLHMLSMYSTAEQFFTTRFYFFLVLIIVACPELSKQSFFECHHFPSVSFSFLCFGTGA
jgi:hypothetical protein